MIYTQEQLEAMADFHISKAVLNIKSGNGDFFPTTTSNSHCRAKLFKGGYVDFDINNPSDMMPLAFECNLSVINLGDGEYMATDGYLHHSMTVVDESHSSSHKNPLRALAIVWILVKQG